MHRGYCIWQDASHATSRAKLLSPRTLQPKKCNMFAWCDPAMATEGKCDPPGLNDKSLPQECTLWLSVEGEMLLPTGGQAQVE